MITPGAITLTLQPEGAVLATSGGLESAAMLNGRGPAEVVAMVMRLHAVCPMAQGHAARLALAAAQGEPAAPVDMATHEVMVCAEALREHGLRICLDWARLADGAPQAGSARAFMAAAAGVPDRAVLDDLLAREVYGCPPEVWLARTGSRPALEAWVRSRAAATEGIAARFLAMVLTMAAPPAATALVTRHAHHPLIAELADGPWLLAAHAARLVDLAGLPARIDGLLHGAVVPLAGQGSEDDRHEGIARVHCSRGDLAHGVVLKEERVSAYTIVSPTARTFAARGIAHALLAPWRDARPAEIAIQALDPCAPYMIHTGRPDA